MRALRIAAVVLAAAAGLTACGQDAGTASGSAPATSSSAASTSPASVEPPSASSTKPPAPASPPSGQPGQPAAPISLSPTGDVVVADGVTQVPAAQIDAGALPTYYEHHGDVWVYDDGYSLAMFAAASSGCSDAEAVVVDQSADGVKITMRPLDQQPGDRPDNGGACSAVMTPRPVAVKLDQPLGDRTIYLGIGR
ncbi:MAG TPA: hypothetical protein VH969_17845 [Actinophytocola sp.]|jgi:hypothetical protein|uniref:hypothetical protein n=1 Tax=Actinophytocola sp. TaxID=1872138 RepID=UPI002F93002E